MERYEDLIMGLLQGDTPKAKYMYLLELLDGNTDLLTIPHLMRLHPQLDANDAKSLLEFCNIHTIRHKDCYGNGDILYPKWVNEMIEKNKKSDPFPFEEGKF